MHRTILLTLVGATFVSAAVSCGGGSGTQTTSTGAGNGAPVGGAGGAGTSAGGSNTGGTNTSSTASGTISTGSGGAGAGGASSSSGSSSGGGGGPGCTDGQMVECYSGDPATKGVGTCVAGKQTCSGGQFGPCTGEVTPVAETCNGLDDDCDGQVDEDMGQATCGLGACQVTIDVCQNGVPVVCTPLPGSPVDTCDGTDDNCDGAVDEACPCVHGTMQPCYSGPAGTQNMGECKGGTQTCQNGVWGPCNGEVTPKAESCNGKDDDCDGEIDEALAPIECGIGACKQSVPACLNGVPQPCQPGMPQPEACDGVDNDCNGVVDDGLPPATCGLGQCANSMPSCVNGQPAQCVPKPTAPETCDGLDNDCDGVVDNGNPGGGVACNTGNAGVCAIGTTSCTNGAIACNQNKQPSAEICNGLDDNCDGTIDEGNPGGGMPCNTGKPGVCAAGTTVCSNGVIVCQQNVQPSAEQCDGLDNDCDGLIDDGNPGGGTACNTGKPGVCATGTTACANGAIVCNQNVQPTPEQCDGIDNDCNGSVDEGNPESGAPCTTGLYGECAAGVTACSNGAVVCNQIKQPSAEICNGLDDDCDGIADDGNPGGGASCNLPALKGPCATGKVFCINGALSCLQTTFAAAAETCANGIDDDCNGQVDEDVDADGDGWGACSGDCCDRPGPCSATPALVNPGAYEVLNNGVNDDCNANTSDTVAPALCSTTTSFSNTTVQQLVQAMDICNFTTAGATGINKTWGVILNQSVLTSADGVAAAPNNVQVGVLNNFGTNVLPKKGTTMAALSSGAARDSGDPGFVNPNGAGWNAGNAGNPPPAYLAAHGGVLQTTPGCPSGAGAYDSVNLKVRMRVPTNAKSFSYNLKFYSAEYPEWVCDNFNDFFLALLTSQVAGIPADKNISFDANNNPISVNNGFFQVCSGCTAGTNELVGTGWAGTNLTDGGGTLWLQTSSPVVPGEELTLEFVIFDVGDHQWDSLILLDNFQWSLNPATVGTIPQ